MCRVVTSVVEQLLPCREDVFLVVEEHREVLHVLDDRRTTSSLTLPLHARTLTRRTTTHAFQSAVFAIVKELVDSI